MHYPERHKTHKDIGGSSVWNICSILSARALMQQYGVHDMQLVWTITSYGGIIEIRLGFKECMPNSVHQYHISQLAKIAN